MPRTANLKEWIGKRPESMPPPRVRMRIFERANGVCHHCKIAIKVPVESWQADHVIALINGGENREANLAPIHGHCHVQKTTADVAKKSKLAKVRQKHHGIKDAPARPLHGRSSWPPPQKTREMAKKPLAPRAMFVAKEAGR